MREISVLLRFRVENYASLLEEQELSLIAEEAHEERRTMRVPGSSLSAQPVAAIFGANASGKSNVVRALGYMRRVVLDSHRRWQPDGGVERLPFMLSGAGAERPSTFAVDLVLDEVRYEYGFTVDDSQVLEEWLFSYPHRKRRKLFVRDRGGVFGYGDAFSGRRKVIEDIVRSNSLYLSAGASNNHPLLLRLHSWFRKELRIATEANYAERFAETVQLWETRGREQVEDLLRYADFGVESFDVSEDASSDEEVARLVQALRILHPDSVDEEDLSAWMKSRRTVRLAHRGSEGTVAIDPGLESSGTRTWTGLLGPVVSALNTGSVLVIDELDARLHPLLAARLVALFQEEKTNPLGAQLIFNTHDTSLLSPGSDARLRRDQVWLVEKGHADGPKRAAGASELIALLEYRPRDRVENLEKRYLAGRYGALPYFDEELIESFTSGEERVR